MDAVDIFLQIPPKCPTLSESTLRRLCVQGRQGNLSAREQLLHAHLGLIVHVAKYFYHPGAFFDLADLIQQGCLGLLHAIDKFNPHRLARGKSVRFATYAYYWITHSIRREIENNGRIIAVPIARLRENKRLDQASHNSARTESLQGAVAMAFLPLVFIDAPAGREDENGPTLGNVVDREDTPDVWCRAWDGQRQVKCFLSQLPARTQHIFRFRYGLSGTSESLNQKQVAEKLGVSSARISHLERTALHQLRAYALSAHAS